MSTIPDEITAFTQHDHKTCSFTLLGQADQLARDAGLRLTPVRRRTLEILLEEHRALGAYDVLEKLAESGFGNQPPVAYRALEFLVENGLAHRVRRLNAFTACTRPGTEHAPMLYICKTCNIVAESPDLSVAVAVKDVANQIGFTVDRASTEVVGTCPACQDAATK